MTTITLAEAQECLSALVHALTPGEEIVILENERPVARLVASPAEEKAASSDRAPRKSGTLRGTVLYMAPDFDAPLDDFKEYME